MPPSLRAGHLLKKPQAANEKWTCAAFWYVWSDMAVDEFGEAMVARLGPAMREAAAREASAHWEKQAVLEMGLGMGEPDPETELYIELQTDKAWELAQGVVWGEDYAFVSILGQCALPAGQ